MSGLASGFDWKSMVDQLTNVERSPQRRMRSEQAGIRAKNSAYTKLKSELDSLKSPRQETTMPLTSSNRLGVPTSFAGQNNKAW